MLPMGGMELASVFTSYRVEETRVPAAPVGEERRKADVLSREKTTTSLEPSFGLASSLTKLGFLTWRSCKGN